MMFCFKIGFGKKLHARLDLLMLWCQPTGWIDESRGILIRFLGFIGPPPCLPQKRLLYFAVLSSFFNYCLRETNYCFVHFNSS
jgi:hypothetical protein